MKQQQQQQKLSGFLYTAMWKFFTFPIVDRTQSASKYACSQMCVYLFDTLDHQGSQTIVINLQPLILKRIQVPTNSFCRDAMYPCAEINSKISTKTYQSVLVSAIQPHTGNECVTCAISKELNRKNVLT